MLIATIGQYEVHLPTSGGKAGKGKALSCSLQVRQGGVILKQFRFMVGDLESRKSAVRKAKEFIATHSTENRR